MDKGTVLNKLNEIQRWEWTGVAQYMQYHFLVRGPWRQVFSAEFKEGAEESLTHASKIGEKIVALGGTPTLERAEVKQTIQLEEMLQNSLAFEEGAVKLYTEAIKLADEWGNKALVVLLEDILLDEQEGAEAWAKILATTDTSATLKSASKVG
jgi:bacterioferritin